MFSMTKSRELDEEQRQEAGVNKRHYGEDLKFFRYKVYSIVTLMLTRAHKVTIRITCNEHSSVYQLTTTGNSTNTNMRLFL